MTFIASAASAESSAETENLLTEHQIQIVERAVAHIKARNRDSCRKYIRDLIRARHQPVDNTDVRYCCSIGLHRYRH